MVSRPALTARAAAALLLLAMTGCDEGSGGSGSVTPGDDALAAALERLPGVTGAVVETVEVDDGQVEELVTVTAEPEASAEQLGEILTTIAADTAPDDSPGSFRLDGALLLGAPEGEPTWPGRPDDGGPSGIWFAVSELDDAAAVGERAARIRAPVDAVPEAVVQDDGGELEVLLDSAGGMTDALSQVGEVMSALAAGGPPTSGPVRVRASVSGEPSAILDADRLDADALATWPAVAAGIGPEVLRDLTLVVVGLGREGAPDALDVSLGLELPGFVPPARLTQEAYGAQLWPTILAQLDLLRERRVGSLNVSNDYRPSPDAPPASLDTFLDLSIGDSADGADRGEDRRGWTARARKALG